MKICAYVQGAYAKQNYANECMDKRQFVGLRVIVDCLVRAGYEVDYAGVSSVHQYDVVLVSLTSDCDWWPFIQERQKWKRGEYKVLIGGAGVLHVSPFLPWFYAAMFGRGENLIVPLVKAIERGEQWENESVAYADDFSEDRIYRIAQVRNGYPHPVPLVEGAQFCETTIGCNHRCLFCGYTWQRRFVSPHKTYQMDSALFTDISNKELAMLDMAKDKTAIDFSHLRTTAIDGFSERIRFGVNKKISREMMRDFLVAMIESDAAPHRLKIYNICGYPSETTEDWQEYAETVAEADAIAKPGSKQWGIDLHSTPFRPMPATPMACAAASKKNYRGLIGKTIGTRFQNGILFQGRSVWSAESLWTDGLPTVMLSMICHRGSREDAENIGKLCATPKFWRASGPVKEATLLKYFNMDRLFSAFTPETLPSRYLRTYANVEKMWGKTPLEQEWRKQHED